tara:strand:+ start:43 stop:336 length:294 start_codon:yes stop_codon:yes gene_type:complete
MINKNKEVLKILEENKITNFQTPEDKIRMEINKKIEEVDHTIVDDRGPNDLERMSTDKDKLIADLKYDNKSLAKQVEDKVEEVKALKIKLELLDNKP